MQLFLSLGPTPLANSFLKSPSEFSDEPYFPLDLHFCPKCSLVQLLDVIDPEVLFHHYLYVTGTSDTIAEHNLRYARTVTELLNLTPDDLVVEIASNDGSLMKCFQHVGVQTLGVEPAANLAVKAGEEGVPTLNRFFSFEVGAELRDTYGPAKAVIANNVLAHVDDTQNFLRGCRELVSDDGFVIFEVPYLGDLSERLEYDTVYHEHLCYFSITALLQLCTLVGLSVVRIDRIPVHGGSLRFYAGVSTRYRHHANDVLDAAEQEKNLGLTTINLFHRFAGNVQRSRRQLIELLENLIARGKRVSAYGAPAKGNTLLNYCGIGTDLVSHTVDKNPLKIGLYTPGMHLPILPVTSLLELQPDYTLILAWNFAIEIMRQQHDYLVRGGKFITPVPEAKVL